MGTSKVPVIPFVEVRKVLNKVRESVAQDSIRRNKHRMPIGIIPRIQIQRAHLEFLSGNECVEWIMIDIDEAELLVKKEHTASTAFGPNIKVITTTTIEDSKLVKYHLERELAIIRVFQPDYHIPCDRPLYITQYEKERSWFVETYVREVSRFVDGIKGFGTNVVPLIKGVSHKEREICYQQFEKLGFDYVAYYSGQYFGRGRGNRIRELVEDIRTIISESGIRRLLLIGLQSNRCLEQLPPQVIAAAGQRWISESGLREVSIEKAQENFCRWKINAEEKLCYGQDVLPIQRIQKKSQEVICG